MIFTMLHILHSCLIVIFEPNYCTALHRRHIITSSKVWHRCRFKPPNCRLARAARVVCVQPGTVVWLGLPESFVYNLALSFAHKHLCH